MYKKESIMKVAHEIDENAKKIKPYFIICQPRRDKNEKPAQNLDGHHSMHLNVDGYSRAYVSIDGEKVDVARNYLMECAIESDAKYMLFVGEDTVLPFDAFHKLHETAEKNPGCMVTGVYYVKLSIPMIMVRKGECIVPANVDPGQIIEAYETGLDAALIPISILKALKEEDPECPFCCIINKMEGIDFIGEDNFFNYRLRKAGFRILTDTNVQCLHMDLATGKYTAHPSVDIKNYFTNMPITTPLTMADKYEIDKRWFTRLPKMENEVKEGEGGEISKLLLKYGNGTDKNVGIIQKSTKDFAGEGHAYGKWYDEILSKYNRESGLIYLLEIGVERGGSLCAWREYFKNGKIYGVDIADTREKDFIRQDVEFIHSDIKNVNLGLFWDIVIDDGSHLPEDVLFTVKNYFPFLKDDGKIIVEDVGDPVNTIVAVHNELKEYAGKYKIQVYDNRQESGKFDECLIVIEKVEGGNVEEISKQE